MFVRTKKTPSGLASTVYSLVECYREDGRVRQRVLCYLGEFPTVEEALAGLADLARTHRELAARLREKADGLDWAGHRREIKYHRHVAESCERWARHYEARLAKLRAVLAERSAQTT
jgi:hypothetical protein